MSFAVGYMEPVVYPERDFTSLDTVLEALRGSSKGQLLYPEPLSDNGLSSELCDSKYIGDLQHITASHDFRDEVSFCDNYEEETFDIFAGECRKKGKNFKDNLLNTSINVNSGLENIPVFSSANIDETDSNIRTGPSWTSYRTQSPNKSDARNTLLDILRREGDPHDVSGEAEDVDDAAGLAVYSDMEDLLARLQIDQSLPAVVSRVKQYQSAYVARVASIHAVAVAELQRCQQQRQQHVQQQQQQTCHQQQTLQLFLQQHSHKLMSRKADEAEQRKTSLLSQLAEQQQQQEQHQQQQENERKLIEQQQQQQQLQNKQCDLVVGLKESFEQFSSALDQVLREIRECDGVELPPATDAELNSTLQQGSEVLQQVAAEAVLQDDQLLHHTSDRLSHGITVLQHIQTIIDTTKSGKGELSRESSVTSAIAADAAAADAVTADAAAVDAVTADAAAAEEIPTAIAADHPESGSILSEAKSTFDKLKEVHASVSAMSCELMSQTNQDLRSRLSRALTIVNQFNNQSASSNRQKLHQLLNLVTGASCEAGGVTVNLGGDKQGPAAMFVREQLASRLISLSHDKQVSSQAVYASLMLRLWKVDPLIQHLCLYHLYKTCPYLVPYIPKRQDYDNEVEFHRALGYRHKEGEAREALNNYLKRMEAAGKLYGRLVSMHLDGCPGRLADGWQLLSRLLLCPPQSAGTACVITGFLSTAGHALSECYGSQFHKLVALFSDRFLPLLEGVTNAGGEADIQSLKMTLTNYFSGNKDKAFPPPPEGYRSLL